MTFTLPLGVCVHMCVCAYVCASGCVHCKPEGVSDGCQVFLIYYFYSGILLIIPGTFCVFEFNAIFRYFTVEKDSEDVLSYHQRQWLMTCF